MYSFTLTNAVWIPDSDINDRLTRTATGWKYANEDDETEIYDATGKLLSISNRAGFIQTLTYSDGTAGANGGYVLDITGNPTTTVLTAGLPIRVTDPSGRSLNFGYDSLQRIVKMTDPSGGVYKYAYDASGNLSSVAYPDGKVRTYLYGEANHVSAIRNAGVYFTSSLTGMVDENGNRYATWNYDSQGRAYSSEHGTGIDKVILTYNADGTTTAADSLGASHTYGFGIVLGVPHNTTLVDGRGTMSRTYDANGNLSSRTDFDGNVTTWQYDPTRNLVTSRTDASGTSLARTVATQWSPNFRLPTQISEPGRTTSNAYDPATGNLLSRSVTDIASKVTRTWTYAYTTSLDNTLPNLLKSVDGPRTDVADITSYAYYPNGDLKTVTDALGHVATFTSYDGAGRPLSVTDPNGVVTVLAYTPRGWLASRKVGALTTTYSYDGVGNVTRVALPDGSRLDYTYDAAHRLTDITDTVLDHVHYTLDNEGNRIREDVYDSNGKLSRTHSRVFDNLSRLTQDIRSYNATTSYVTNYGYDGNGNLIKTVDGRNNVTTYGYDALNRISQTTDAALGITRYTYDALDQLTGVTDPKSFNTHYAPNALGDETQLASPDSGTSSRTFDSAGNIASATDARGVAVAYAYDALDRPLSVSFPSTGENMAFVWDAGAGCTYGIGRICQVTDADGSTSFAYDDQGNLVKKTRNESGASFVTQYVYDPANRLVTVITPTGETLSMGRDAAGRIQDVRDTSLSGTSKIATNIQYDGTGQATSLTLGNGVTQIMGFDYSGQMGTVNSVKPLSPADIDANTVRLFFSGSYLKQSVLEPALLGFYQPGSLSVFRDGTVTGSVGTATGANFRAYLGIAGPAAPASLSGRKVLVLDTSQDSANGLIPLSRATTASIVSLDASCAPTGGADAAGQWLWACPNTASAVPDAGMIDVEPALFTGFNLQPGLPLVQQSSLTAAPVINQVEGIIATDNFLTLGPGGTDMLPSLSKPQIVSLMNGLTTDWNWVDASIAAGPVAVCRGVQGSGSQAVIDALLFGFPCSVSSLNPATHEKIANFGAGGGNYVVIENASPDALAKCMGYVQNGTPAGMTIDITTGMVSSAPADATHVVLPSGGRGIGMMSLNRPSRDPVSEPYHFVAIDGVSPSMANAATGAYDLTVESVMARRNVTVNGIAPIAGGQLDLYSYISAALANPAILGAAKIPSVPGVAALANPITLNFDPATTVYNGQTILLNPVFRVSRNGSTCRPMVQVQ